MRFGRIICLAAFVVALLAAPQVRAETNQVRISHGYSSGYLPLMIIRDQHLLERHAAVVGFGTPEVTWQARWRECQQRCRARR